MRTLKKNRQKMWYSVISDRVPIYELDDDDNPIIDYVDDDGNIHYLETGTYEEAYSEPVLFYAPISSKLNEMRMKEYGIDASSVYCEISVEKGKVDLPIGARIWRTSKVVKKENGYVDEESADYIVKGSLVEFLNFDFFLLEKNIK